MLQTVRNRLKRRKPPGLTVKQAFAIVAAVTYKPGWRVTLEPDPFPGHVVLRVSVDMVPAGMTVSPPGHNVVKVQVTGTQVLGPLDQLTEERLLNEIQRQIQAMEMHEVDEWLKYKGKHVREPHPGTSTT